MIEQTYKLSMIPFEEQVRRNYEIPIVPASQYDKTLRTLSFELYNGEDRFTIPAEAVVYIFGMKPDGNAFQYQMTVEDNMAKIAMKTQMTTVAGCVTCEIVLFEENTAGPRIGSANFKLMVEKCAVGDDAQFSESDMPVIQTLLFGGTPGDILVKDVDGAKWNSESSSIGYMRYQQYDPDRTGTVNSARNSETVDGHTVARNVLADEYTNAQIDGKVQAVQDDVDTLDSSAVKSVNTITPVDGNVTLSKFDVGLGNVDNTSDADKPISTATQTALDGKQATLTFDTTPTAGSTNPVTSDGIASVVSALNSNLSQKQDKLTFDTEPTENSVKPVTSGGIFLSQKAQDKKFDTLADLLNAKYADDWATIQAMIQIGYGTKYYPVGTQFTVHHDAYGDVLFDVVQHITPESDALHKAMLPTGKEYGMVLLMHNVIYSTQFDEVEGFYYCENGLTAGTYNVTITRQPWFAGDVGKTFQFTLASDVPAGAILWWDGYNATREGRTVRVFNTRGATSAAQTATMTEGNGGTSLGNIDGTGNCNYFDRTVLGSNDWEESGVRQWLNANTASDWWEPKTKWDRLVSYYSRPGFLYGLDADFKNVLVETTHGNRSNTVFDSHGTNVAYNTTEKIFLLCNEEMNLAQEQGIVCGTVYDYYKDAANADRIKYDITSTGTARLWWLRSPHPSYVHYERIVNTSGALNYGFAYYGFGVAAACVIA